MIRKYNYKRKKQINHDMWDITVDKTDGLYFLKINNLDLSSLDLNPDDEIFLKVWTAQSTKKHVYLGTIAKPELDPVIEKRLLPFVRENITKQLMAELFVCDPLKTYIKKTSSSKFVLKNFKLLQNEGSLLPVTYYDIGELPWNIEYSTGNEMPVLNLSEKLKEHDLIEHLRGKRRLIQSLIVYPAVKEVLRKIIIELGSSTPDDASEPWCASWLTFMITIYPETVPVYNGANFLDIEEWIESASKSLSDKGRFLDGIKDEILNLR